MSIGAVERVETRADQDVTDFDEFFRATSARALGIVLLTIEDRGVAEDAVQTAYLRAFCDWQRIRAMGRREAWIVRVATRAAIDIARKKRREVMLDSRLPVNPDDRLTALQVRWGLDKLSPRQRAAVILHYVYGLPLAEVAIRLAVGPETLRTHLRRARRRLKGLRIDADE